MQKFTTSGVCAKTIEFKIQDGILKNVKFNGGCPGNISISRRNESRRGSN